MSQYWNIRTNLEDNTTNLGNADTEGYGQISVLLSKYVLKEKGKGLSTNDFTNNDKQKLDSIEVGAERNLLETISINNGTPYIPDSNKNINLNIATKTSQLENDSQFAVLEGASLYADYRDSYVGKSKISFADATNIPIGKDSIATSNGIAIGACSNASNGIAIGYNVSTSNTYEININNRAKYNKNTSLWEMKTTDTVLADCALSNTNGTSLTCLDTVISDLANEIEVRCQEDTTLQSNINCVCNRVCTIESYIPNQTSDTNQLADKDFVNSSIQTNTANFRGNWSDWAEVPTNEEDYPPDYVGDTTPTTNDYMVLQNASDYPLETLSGTWRFKYIGNWTTDGKNGWIPEYQVNEEPFTSEQLYAINSGITSNKVENYDNHLTNTNNPHNVTKSQVGLNNVDNTADNTKCVKDSVCFNGLTYAEVCSDILSNVEDIRCINVYCDNSCQCSITKDSNNLCLGANAFNSTAFTTCTGTVTGIKVYCGTTCLCTIDDITCLCLGANAFCNVIGDGTVTSVNVSVNGKTGTAVTTSGTVTISNVCACIGNLTNTTTTDQHILTTANTTAGCKAINTSSSCTLTFNPSTGLLKTTKVMIGSCPTIQYNSTTQAIEFVF